MATRRSPEDLDSLFDDDACDFRTRQYRDQFESAEDALSDAQERVSRRADDGTPLATPADYDNYAKAWKVYTECLEKLHAAEQASRAEAARKNAIGKVERKEVIVNELLEQYGDKGAQYRHLIDLIAGITVKMEAHLESGGADDMYMKLVEKKLDLISQLQKYTESSKSESTVVTAVVTEFSQKFLAVLEPHLRDQPTVLKAIVGDFKKLLTENPQ